jgi:ABC-2 type transport system permease protein
VENGSVDIGVVVPPSFDDLLQEGAEMPLSLYVWGESMLKNRIILTATLSDLITTLSGREMTVTVEPVALGDNDALPIQERLLPMLVLMSVVLGGTMVPALSLVEEKQNRTLKALVITPTTLEDVFLAKGAFGVIVGMVMASIILIMNQAFGAHPAILLLVLFIGAIASAAFGLFFAAFVKDVTTLMAIAKATGLLLYAPGLLQIFPDIPSWVARIFPTYYLIGPVIEVTQKGGGWSDITNDLAILIVLTLAMVAGAAYAVRRLKYQPT